MLLLSAALLALCMVIVVLIVRREQRAGASDASKTGEEESVSSAEALRLLGSSRHLQIISMVIAFAAIGAAIIEQQLNMATAEAKGATNTDAITAFLAQITVYLSLIGFVIQVGLTSRIHRYLGIGFALLILPVSLGSTAVLMLAVGALWTPGVARILDTSLRYTVDKTSREILFLPLPADLKYRAKPFIDVTMDRVAKGLGALLILVLIKDWGLGLTWQQLSYASLTMMVLWVFFAMRARKQYLAAFRRSIEQQNVRAGRDPARHRRPQHDRDAGRRSCRTRSRGGCFTPSTCWSRSTSATWSRRSCSGTKSPEVRARALAVGRSGRTRSGVSTGCRAITQALKDANAGGARWPRCGRWRRCSREDARELMRPYLYDADPQLVVTAACALAESAERGRPPGGGGRAAAAGAGHPRAGGPNPAGRRARRSPGAQPALPAAARPADVRRRSVRRARGDPERGTPGPGLRCR